VPRSSAVVGTAARLEVPGCEGPTGSGRSPELRQASVAASVADIRASAVGGEDGVQRRGQRQQVAVVDAAVLQLVGQLAEEEAPVPTRRRERRRDLDPSLDDLDR
jgi:hypothetical protein